jgi:hypothetical protein
MGYGARWKEAGEAAQQEAERAAAEHGFGGHLKTRTFAGGGTGCAALLIGIVLLVVGIGILVGSGSPTGKGIGAGLVVLGVGLPVVTIWRSGRNDHLLVRLHLFERGLVFTGPGGTRVHPWEGITFAERTDRGTYGSAGHSYVHQQVQVRTANGDVLCTLAARSEEGRLVTQLARGVAQQDT